MPALFGPSPPPLATLSSGLCSRAGREREKNALWKISPPSFSSPSSLSHSLSVNARAKSFQHRVQSLSELYLFQPGPGRSPLPILKTAPQRWHQVKAEDTRGDHFYYTVTTLPPHVREHYCSSAMKSQLAPLNTRHMLLQLCTCAQWPRLLYLSAIYQCETS